MYDLLSLSKFMCNVGFPVNSKTKNYDLMALTNCNLQLYTAKLNLEDTV